MSYTVKQLAKLSGVTVRTLHYYDEMGLLKPAHYGENQYRYYGEEQLLLLQQILFYRELGFSLSDIQKILESDSFDKIEALKSHRNILKESLGRTKNLIETVDKTIAHLRGKIKMKHEELYYGFDSEKQKEHEKYLVKEGIVTQEMLDESHAKVKNWTEEQKIAFIQDIEKIMKELIVEMENKASPSSEKVQKLIKEHFKWLQRSWNPTKEKYLGLMELYQTPGFSQFYNDRHPELLDFLLKAMKVFADHEL